MKETRIGRMPLTAEGDFLDYLQMI